MKKILIPIPSHDFDPTEAGVTWKLLRENGIQITFSTPDGKPAIGDQRMVTGQGLGVWKAILRADKNGVAAYLEMIRSQEFQNPLSWAQTRADQFDGIALPGGHAPGMKEYLESKILQNLIVEFFKAKKLIGAICHGVVLAARSKDNEGRSVLHGRKVTALLRTQELTAWSLTCLWLKNYYRTYKETVQAEVTRNLAAPIDFIAGPTPLKRDCPENLKPGFTVEDKNLITARWPGDAHNFGSKLAKRLQTS